MSYPYSPKIIAKAMLWPLLTPDDGVEKVKTPEPLVLIT
jgi:hypothetical protein